LIAKIELAQTINTTIKTKRNFLCRKNLRDITQTKKKSIGNFDVGNTYTKTI
jgi:hypothetical protein